MMRKPAIVGFIGMALLSACTFDNDSGQFAIDLNEPVQTQSEPHTEVVTNIIGVYRSMPTKNDEHFQEMRINKLDKQRYEVTITTPGVSSGCKFKTVVHSQFSHMLIPLNQLNADLHSTMVIQFTTGKATVDTTQPVHFNDLASFCGSGRSLVGGYYKVP